MQCVLERNSHRKFFGVKDVLNGLCIQLHNRKHNLFLLKKFHFELHVNYSYLSNNGSTHDQFIFYLFLLIVLLYVIDIHC